MGGLSAGSGLALAALLVTCPSFAQGGASEQSPSPAAEGTGSPAVPASGDRAAAEVLYKQAYELVQSGDYATACPKFEAALALWASAATQIQLARCHEQEGRIASAWTSYRAAIVLNRETLGDERQQQLEDIAQAGADALEPRLPKLLVRLESPVPPPEGLRIDRARGGVYPVQALGEALPIDPGEVSLTFSAPGYRSVTEGLTIREGDSIDISIWLEPAPEPEPVTTLPGPLAPAIPPSGDLTTDEGPPTWVWPVGAAGVVAVGVSVAFLIDDLDAISTLRDECPELEGETVCNAGYDYEADNARKNRGFGLFLGFGIAGVAALTASAFGIATSGGGESEGLVVVPVLGAEDGGLMMRGRF